MSNATDQSEHKFSGVETIAEGITRRTLHDGRIIIMEVNTVRIDAITKWLNVVKDTLNNWEDADRPYLILYHVGANFVLSRYIRNSIKEMNTMRPDVKGQIAAVVRSWIMVRIAQLFAKERSHASRKIKIFDNLDDGISWLEEGLGQWEIQRKFEARKKEENLLEEDSTV